jgi:hypothetical protein
MDLCSEQTFMWLGIVYLKCDKYLLNEFLEVRFLLSRELTRPRS